MMSNCEKKLDALIDALGFDVKEVVSKKFLYNAKDMHPSGNPISGAVPSVTFENADYKLTKRKYNEKPTIHKIVRIYEKGEISAGEMIARINEQVWEEQ